MMLFQFSIELNFSSGMFFVLFFKCCCFLLGAEPISPPSKALSHWCSRANCSWHVNMTTSETFFCYCHYLSSWIYKRVTVCKWGYMYFYLVVTEICSVTSGIALQSFGGLMPGIILKRCSLLQACPSWLITSEPGPLAVGSRRWWKPYRLLESYPHP